MNERLALGPRIAISGSIPPDNELEKYGWVAANIEGALREIIKEVLAAGGSIVHGGHPSFTRVIKEGVEAMNPRPGEPRRVRLFASRCSSPTSPVSTRTMKASRVDSERGTGHGSLRRGA